MSRRDVQCGSCRGRVHRTAHVCVRPAAVCRWRGDPSAGGIGDPIRPFIEPAAIGGGRSDSDDPIQGTQQKRGTSVRPLLRSASATCCPDRSVHHQVPEPLRARGNFVAPARSRPGIDRMAGPASFCSVRVEFPASLIRPFPLQLGVDSAGTVHPLGRNLVQGLFVLDTTYIQPVGLIKNK
jgi:hypothetical protein